MEGIEPSRTFLGYSVHRNLLFERLQVIGKTCSSAYLTDGIPRHVVAARASPTATSRPYKLVCRLRDVSPELVYVEPSDQFQLLIGGRIRTSYTQVPTYQVVNQVYGRVSQDYCQTSFYGRSPNLLVTLHRRDKASGLSVCSVSG